MKRETKQVLDLYPRIFFACHTRHVRDEKTGKELSEHQMHILSHLDEVQPTRLTGLARHMGVTPSTMSLSVDRLVRGGYIVKGPDEEDARAIGLRLTRDGARIKEADNVLDPQRVEALLGLLTADERSRAVAGLALLAKAGGALVHAHGRG